MRTSFKALVRHPLSPFRRRTLYSLIIVVLVLLAGTEGMVVLEGWSYVDAFYFMSLIATTQGPARSPSTDAGKIFAAIMAFTSVGAVLSSAAFIFGPLLGTLLKDGFDYLEREEKQVRGWLEKREEAPKPEGEQ